MAKTKLCALFLTLIMALNMCVVITVHAADKIYASTENETYAKILNQFGIYSFYNDEGLFYEDTKGVTRAEAAKALASLLGYEEFSGSVSDLFIDVPDYHEYSGVISTVVNLGLMVGTGPGEFSPDSIIKVEHFIKSIVIALGYDYKAQRNGGYPSGYVAVATEFELLKGVNQSLSEDLTRETLIRILYNSLNVEIPLLIGMIGQNSQYTTREGHTVLTEYHDIYTDKGVVQTSDIFTLNPYYNSSNEKIVIGTDTLYVGDMTDIFNFFGHEVRYYYKLADEEKTLVLFSETSRNEIVTLSRYDVVSVETNKITYKKDDSNKKTAHISSNANIFYNGETVTSNINNLFRNFADKLILLDNTGDNEADVVFIEDYIYDIIDSVNLEDKKIYLRDHTINYSRIDFISIEDTTGKKLDVSELPNGCVVGFAEDIGDKLIMRVISAPRSARIESISDGEVETADKTVYKLHKNLSQEMLDKLELGKNILIVTNENSEILWTDSTKEENMKIGYLIRTLEHQESRKEFLVACDILDVTGEVARYMLDEKITVDGTRMEREDVKSYLMQIKEVQNTKADGETSQVVYYKTDDNGVLKQLYTAGNAESSMISMVYNSNERGKAGLRDHGYGVGVFAGAYGITNEVPVFKIPGVNLESYDDRYFAVGKYGTGGIFKDGGLYDIDIYKDEATDIMPSAVVMYTTDSLELNNSASLFLVEKAVRAVNSEDEVTTKLEGYYDGVRKECYADTSLVMPELSPGDVCAIAFDQIDTIIAIKKVYDFESNTVSEEYALQGGNGTNLNGVGVLHVYNAPANSKLIEAFKTDFSLGVPGEEKKILINTRIHVTSKNDYTFDIYTNEGKAGIPDRILDYLHDETCYARVLVRYDAGYQKEAIYYQ